MLAKLLHILMEEVNRCIRVLLRFICGYGHFACGTGVSLLEPRGEARSVVLVRASEHVELLAHTEFALTDHTKFALL